MNARVRSSVTAYAMAMIFGYSGFALAGYFIPVRQGPPLPDATASAALSHAFGEEVPAESAWHASRGTIFRGWLVRRAYVRGHLKTADGVVFSEQVLNEREVEGMFRRKRLACSFCGKSEVEVAKLVAGPKVTICDRCVAIAVALMEGRSVPRAEHAGARRGRLKGLLRLHRRWHDGVWKRYPAQQPWHALGR